MRATAWRTSWCRPACTTTASTFSRSPRAAPARFTACSPSITSTRTTGSSILNPDGSLDFTPPFDRPYDWTASGDPKLLARLFSFFTTDAGLKEIKTYADGIGPWKRYIVSTAAVDLDGDGVIGDENGDGKIDDADRQLLPATDLIARAHREGLLVHTWTFRNEQRRLPADYGGNPVNEYLHFYELGIDGMFSDFPDTAFAARVLFNLSKSAASAP